MTTPSGDPCSFPPVSGPSATRPTLIRPYRPEEGAREWILLLHGTHLQNPPGPLPQNNVKKHDIRAGTGRKSAVPLH